MKNTSISIPKSLNRSVSKSIMKYIGMALLLTMCMSNISESKAQGNDINPGSIVGGSNDPSHGHRVCFKNYSFESIVSQVPATSKTNKKIYYNWYVSGNDGVVKSLEQTFVSDGVPLLYLDYRSKSLILFDNQLWFSYVARWIPDLGSVYKIKFYRYAYTDEAAINDPSKGVPAPPITFVLDEVDKLNGGGGFIEAGPYGKCGLSPIELKSTFTPAFGRMKWQLSTDNGKNWKDVTDYPAVENSNRGEAYTIKTPTSESLYRRALYSANSGCKTPYYSNEVKIGLFINKPLSGGVIVKAQNECAGIIIGEKTATPASSITYRWQEKVGNQWVFLKSRGDYVTGQHYYSDPSEKKRTYRRMASPEQCFDLGVPSNEITIPAAVKVDPGTTAITNPLHCSGSELTIKNTGLSSSTGVITYFWENSLDGGKNYVRMPGRPDNTSITKLPYKITSTQTVYFRRGALRDGCHNALPAYTKIMNIKMLSEIPQKLISSNFSTEVLHDCNTPFQRFLTQSVGGLPFPANVVYRWEWKKDEEWGGIPNATKYFFNDAIAVAKQTQIRGGVRFTACPNFDYSYTNVLTIKCKTKSGSRVGVAEIENLVNQTGNLPELEFSNRTVVVYPNPVKNEVILKYDSEQGSELQLDVLDMKGNSYLNLKVKTQIGLNLIKLNVSNLQVGTYIIKSVDGNTTTNTKIVKSE